MGFIFDFLGGIFGYILWFFFDAVSNYGFAVTLFTVVINLALFPLMAKQRKGMAAQARMNTKLQALKKKHAKDPKKLQEEQAKLYEREGHNPMSGCLTMILPFILLMGVIGAINQPLQNTLHIPAEKVSQAVVALPTYPEISQNYVKGYEQLQIVKYFDSIKHHLTMFNEKELADIQEFSSGFNFLGVNLLNRPNTSPFSEMLWIIPVALFVISLLGAYINQKTMVNSQADMQGCMRFFPYVITLIIPIFVYSLPGAISLYSLISATIGVIQSLIFNKLYNVYAVNAQSEAARTALLDIQETDVVQIKEIDAVSVAPEKKAGKKSKK